MPLVLLSNALINFPLANTFLLPVVEQGMRFIYFVYLDTSHYLFLPYVYRWFCPCTPPGKSQWNQSLWGLNVGRADSEVLKPGVQRVPGSPACSDIGCICLYVYRPPPPTAFFPLPLQLLCPCPPAFLFMVMVSPGGWGSKWYILLHCSSAECHSELVREWCARSVLLLKIGN